MVPSPVTSTGSSDQLVRQAAQGQVIHTDDTTMKILEFVGERRRKAIEAGDIDPNQRVGLFTSGIVSLGAATEDGESRTPEIALFFTGNKHAGENLERVLKERVATLAPPIHMCDALSSNTAGEFDALLARCVAHARRTFVEIFQNFPDECRRVLEDLRTVYRVDGRAREEQLTADERLALHQKESASVMTALRDWMTKQIKERTVEPNSSLGKAYAYMLRHWEGLTLFLREPGAPLDNNTCYAARGITRAMPRPGICRVESGRRGETRGCPWLVWIGSRHIHRASKKASRQSFGWKRAGAAPEASAWARARSFNRMSA